MNKKTQDAFNWALNQNHRSVAAQYARILAEYIKTIGDIELDYPNWDAKFQTIAEAVYFHTNQQNTIISNLRKKIGIYDD